MEEMCRLGLAMYKISSLCRNGDSEGTEGRLQLSDLHFPVPDSRQLWDAKSDPEFSQLLQIDARREKFDVRDLGNWISVSGKFSESGRENPYH